MGLLQSGSKVRKRKPGSSRGFDFLGPYILAVSLEAHKTGTSTEVARRSRNIVGLRYALRRTDPAYEKTYSLFLVQCTDRLPIEKMGIESLSCLYRISILNCGDSMTEERKHAILLATVILTARRLQPLLRRR